ncbi:MAG: DUF4097 family beta strand repeat protein [Clostridia bacterium]|nr:DUF4097 family beta strand repeat protein [Clostridia bacterium]
MQKRLKKAAIVVGIVAGALILIAVVVGVLNALVADGKWNLGWNDYRYDESGYEIGEGSIPSETITRIELDWIDGEVEIISCQDTFISISESAENELPESAKVRWKVGTDGTLSIKYRKSSWFFGVGSGNRNKKLILRIPASYFEQLTAIDVDVESANVVVYDIFATDFEFESSSGSLGVKDCVFLRFSADTVSGKLLADGLTSNTVEAESVSGSVDMKFPVSPNGLDISTTSGKVTLRLPSDASFVMDWETVSGSLAYDLPLTQTGNRYTCGGGANAFDIETVSGDLTLITEE